MSSVAERARVPAGSARGRMEQVEDAVGEDDPLSPARCSRTQAGNLVERMTPACGRTFDSSPVLLVQSWSVRANVSVSEKSHAWRGR